MEIFDLRLSFREDELREAGEDLQRLLDLDREIELVPPLRRILLALDDAVTDAYHPARAAQH